MDSAMLAMRDFRCLRKTASKSRRTSRKVWCGFFFLPLLATSCFGQKVTVRLVDATSTKPLASHEVYVFGIAPKNFAQKDEQSEYRSRAKADLHLKTDSSGAVRFDLPNPVPDHFFVRPILSGPRWDCFCLVRVATEEVLTKSRLIATGGEANSHGSPGISPNPGEILFSLQPTPWWVQVLYPLLRDYRL
jgi:hypothetical protein